MGIELELSVLLALLVVGASVFAPFEIETPAWRKLLKWSIVIGLTLGLATLRGRRQYRQSTRPIDGIPNPLETFL